MPNMLQGLGRLLAISALGLLLVVLFPLVWLANRIAGCGMAIAEPAKSKFVELWAETFRHG